MSGDKDGGSAKESLPTASQGWTDFDFQGVFRELHDPKVRQEVTKAQGLMGNGAWSEAEKILKTACSQSGDPHDIRNLGVVLREVSRYLSHAIPPHTAPVSRLAWDKISCRQAVKHMEPFTEIPQSVFLLRHEPPGGATQFIAGRRVLSHQYRASRIRELHCSLVTAPMLLGPLADQRLAQDGLIVYYRPLTDEEKLAVMTGVLQTPGQYELVFPFPVLREGSFQELDCPPGGWEIDEPLAEQLGQGEVIIREYSIRFLSSLGRDDLVLYDPACSTGQFLSAMKKGACPRARTIGQDLSPHMVRYASKRLDELHCGDALYPKVPPQSVDVVFVRFVNSEVVKTSMAMPIVTSLANTVKAGGHMIIFGHTPVLVSAADLRALSGWKILQSIGGGDEWAGIFQYYVMKREES